MQSLRFSCEVRDFRYLCFQESHVLKQQIRFDLTGADSSRPISMDNACSELEYLLRQSGATWILSQKLLLIMMLQVQSDYTDTQSVDSV